MRVFVTGATGFIGSAIVRELIEAGHSVLGLARSAEAEKTLEGLGVEAHRGDLEDTNSLADGARACDGVIHTAFIHDFSDYAAAASTDRRAVETLALALEGSGKPFVSTSGTALLASGHIGTEGDTPTPGSAGSHRAAAEQIVLSAADRGVCSSVIRLPPSVHGAGDHGFVPALIDIARRRGFSAFIGDGANRWPAVHRLDAASLYRSALEHATPGSCFHGVAEEGIAWREIAAAIGVGLDVPVRGISIDEAKEHFDWLAGFVAIDNPTSSVHTREFLGWRPQGPVLLDDMRENGYFS